MRKKYNIQDKIEDTIHVLDTIQEVKPSTGFSAKVLDLIENEKNSKEKSIPWFTAQLQLAAMIVILLVNAIVIYHTLNTNTIENNVSGIEQFAKDYNIYSDSNEILN
ncbi:hypothetical protein RQM59_12245 [Flavobacteriaceae bacterium S356]|uniref:Uncharacterized protein n=1 Tax=Asprobacillus argus TaxID=3076534 RepID=A0ABU3LI52_9FLAO|nr:hypothetical protein [Flavobacteriaceae bacterium S356]